MNRWMALGRVSGRDSVGRKPTGWVGRGRAKWFDTQPRDYNYPGPAVSVLAIEFEHWRW